MSKMTKIGRSIIAIISCLLFAAVLYMLVNYYSIGYRVWEQLNARRAAMHSDELQELIDNEDFIELSVFCSKYEIYYQMPEGFTEYNGIVTPLNMLRNLQRDVMILRSTDGYTTVQISSTAYNISSLYHYKIDKGRFSPEAAAFTDDCLAYTDGLLKTYMNFTDEDIAAIPEMSESQLGVLLEERLGYTTEKEVG